MDHQENMGYTGRRTPPAPCQSKGRLARKNSTQRKKNILVHVFFRKKSYFKNVECILTRPEHYWLTDSEGSSGSADTLFVCLTVRLSVCLSTRQINNALRYLIVYHNKSRLLLKFSPVANFFRVVVMKP